ncbi:hypothetical protein Tco_1323722 [Tanacetum coccineum]
MLLAVSELTKEDRESQLYDKFERFKMLPGEKINEYYAWFHKLVNDMRNIIMTMPNIQLNSKFVNNMSPEWDKFVTAVKLNKGLKETNHEQLYAYLKQHEKHATQDCLIIKRITPTTTDQLAFVSSVQPYVQSSRVHSHQYPPSSAPLQSPHVQSLQYPHFAKISQLDSGYTQTDEILDTLTKQVALLAQSFLLREMVQRAMGEHRIELGMPMQVKENRSIVLTDKMLLMQAQENGAMLDEEELLFLAGEQTNNFDADVDDQPVRDLALNDDNIFQEDECDAFDSDVDDEPTSQSIFMANLSSAGPINLQAGPSNASILSEVHDLENAIDHCDNNQDKHEIHNKVQQKNIIESTSDHMGNSNVIPYEQYLSVDDVFVEPSSASYVSNDSYVLHDNDVYVPRDPLVIEPNIYKEQVAIYEQCAKFDLTLREQKMDEQMSILIQDQNKKEANLKKELHSGERGFEQTKRCYLTEVIPFFKLLKEHFDEVQKSLVTEVRAMKVVFKNLEAEVDQNEIDLKSSEIERKNLLITNENLIANCIAQDVFYNATDSMITVSTFSDMHDAFTAAQKRIAELESENSNLKKQDS